MARIPIVEEHSDPDDHIVELFFNRDQQAIVFTDEKYRRYLFSVAFHIVGNRSDCEECINDTYLALWNAIPPHVPVSFKAFLTSIIRKKATDLYRKKKRQKRIPVEMSDSLTDLERTLFIDNSPDIVLEKQELIATLNRFLKTLPPDDRALFVGRYYLCLSIEELAKGQKTPNYKIYNQLNSIKMRLMDQLKKEGFYQ